DVVGSTAPWRGYAARSWSRQPSQGAMRTSSAWPSSRRRAVVTRSRALQSAQRCCTPSAASSAVGSSSRPRWFMRFVSGDDGSESIAACTSRLQFVTEGSVVAYLGIVHSVGVARAMAALLRGVAALLVAVRALRAVRCWQWREALHADRTAL